jgi:hypothetical protein
MTVVLNRKGRESAQPIGGVVRVSCGAPPDNEGTRKSFGRGVERTAGWWRCARFIWATAGWWRCTRFHVGRARFARVVQKYCLVAPVVAVALLSSSCSQANKPAPEPEAEAKKEPTGPPEPVTAKKAYWEMYTSARKWTTDFVTLKVARKDVPGAPAPEPDTGKGAVWEATFGSPSKQEYRTYTYSIDRYPPDVYKGVAVGRGLPWSGVTRNAMSIPNSEFNIDSDVAYKTGASDAAAWLKKNPTKKLATFDLVHEYRFQSPVWFLHWGDKKSGYIAFVDANNGKVAKPTK